MFKFRQNIFFRGHRRPVQLVEIFQEITGLVCDLFYT